MKQIIVRYAVVAAGLLCALGLLNWLLIARPLGYQASEIVGYLSMIVALSMIFFAIRYYRSRISGGTLTFGVGFRIGIWITLITSALFFVYSWIYFLVYGDDFKAWADAHFKEQYSAEQYQAYLNQIEQMDPLYSSPAFQGIVMFLTVFFIGLIITLVSASVLKNTSRTL